MKKHLTIKASVLLTVMFFHSFVLVPVANATAFEGIAGRIAFRAMAPSVIAALGSGTALVVGAVVAGGVGYLIYKSGAVSALKTWLDSTGNPSAEGTNGWLGPQITISGTVYTYWIYFRTNDSKWVAEKRNASGGYIGGPSYAYNTWLQAYQGVYGAAYSPPADPTTPTDYSSQLATAQPSFPSNSLYGTPGVAAAIAGAAAIVSAVSMSDSDADKFIAGSGATAIDSAGTQEGSPPATTDNTVTAGDTATIGLLQQIVNFVSNLVGIKTGVESVKTSVDNVVVGVQSLSGSMDNVGVGINAMRGTMDNVGIAIQNQTAVLDNVGANIAHMDNTLSGINTTTATAPTVQSRIDALKTAASTKFPFSLAGSLSVSSPTPTNSYDFGSLPLTPSISIPIEPMAGPLHTLFDWIRQLLVWFFWLGTLFAILRKGMEM